MRDGPVGCADIISPANRFTISTHLLSSFFLHLSLLSTLHSTMEKKITEKIAALPPDANYFSLEFFPPKTRMVG